MSENSIKLMYIVDYTDRFNTSIRVIPKSKNFTIQDKKPKYRKKYPY